MINTFFPNSYLIYFLSTNQPLVLYCNVQALKGYDCVIQAKIQVSQSAVRATLYLMPQRLKDPC